MKNSQIKYGVLIFSIAMISFLLLNYIEVITTQMDVIQTAEYESREEESTISSSDEEQGTSVAENGQASKEYIEESNENINSTEDANIHVENLYFNLNTVTKEQLCLIDGIGDVTAQKIIDKRIELGSFTDLEQLKSINGIGDKRYTTLIEHLYISE